MEDNAKVKVKNRSHCPVYYTIPDMNNLTREYHGLEEKTVPFEELRKLSYTMGGRVLLEQYLIIRNEEAIEELGLHVEPEYFYEREQVEELLKNGSMDEFLDCLDFAPDGVINLIKECAIQLPLNDVAKREVLLNKLDYDVNKIIEVRKATMEGQEEPKKETATRRAATAQVGSQSQKKDPSSNRRVVLKDDK